MTEIEKILKTLALDEDSENRLRLKLEIFSEEQKLDTKRLIDKSLEYFMIMDSFIMLGHDNKNLEATINAVNQSKTELASLINEISKKLK